MLPPVTATTGSDITFGNLPAQQLAGPQNATVGKTSQIDGATAQSALFARASLASLSSELQFAQNITVLADSIGKIMGVPKQVGESASTYVARLITTINDMAPPQKAILEAQIARILPGLTLEILTDTLKNPTGPQAARLALLLETAPHRGSDLAARAVVSSYRQNIGAEPRAFVQQALSSAGLSRNAAAPAASALQISQRVATAQINPDVVLRNPSTSLPSQGLTNANSAATAIKSILLPMTPQRQSELAASKSAPNLDQRVVSSVASAKPLEAAKTPLLNEQARLRAAQQPASSAQNAAEVRTELTNVAAKSLPLHQLPSKPELPISHQRLLDLRVKFGVTEKSSLAMTTTARDTAIASKETPVVPPNTIAALITSIATARLPSSGDTGQTLFASLFGMVKAGVKEFSKGQSSSAATVNSGVDEILERLNALPRHEVQAKLLEAIRQLPPDHPQVQALLIAAMRNEIAPAHPYVQYPLGDDEYESEHHPRGRWSSSSDEQPMDDNQQQDDGQKHDEQRLAEGEGEPSFSDYDTIEDAAELQAENYYLRMSNFS
jgi:hypothetical protein